MNAVEAQAPPVEADSTAQRSIRYWAALGALGVLFLVATNGPVFWVRLDRGVLTEPLLDDIWVQLAFVIPTATVLVLAAPAARTIWSDRPVTFGFAAFVLVVLASSVWSLTPSQTLEQTTMFVLTTSAALLAGAYVGRFHALVALWLAMQVGVFTSLFAWVRGWPRVTFSVNEILTGIYLNKNSLGPVAILGGVTSVVLGVAAWRRRHWVLVPLTLFALVVDAVIWYESNSYTALVASAVAVVGVSVALLFVPGPHLVVRRVVGFVSIFALGLLATFGVVYRTQLNNDRLGSVETLSGRTVIWDVVLEYANERPLQGWGFMSIWSRPEIIDSLCVAGHRPVFAAHSGYLELYLGVGVVGLALLLVVCGVAVARVGQALWNAPSLMAVWSFALVVYVLSVNLSESFVGPNLLPWVLLCSATGQSVAVLQRLAPGAESPAPSPPPATSSVPSRTRVAPQPHDQVDATPTGADGADVDWWDFSFDSPDAVEADVAEESVSGLTALVSDSLERAGESRRTGWDDGWDDGLDDDGAAVGGDRPQGGQPATDDAGSDGWR